MDPKHLSTIITTINCVSKSNQTEPAMSDPDCSSLPDDAGNAGFSWQQREHGIVSMCLLQAVLSALPRRPLSVQQCKWDVAVGVLVPQRGERW